MNTFRHSPRPPNGPLSFTTTGGRPGARVPNSGSPHSIPPSAPLLGKTVPGSRAQTWWDASRRSGYQTLPRPMRDRARRLGGRRRALLPVPVCGLAPPPSPDDQRAQHSLDSVCPLLPPLDPDGPADDAFLLCGPFVVVELGVRDLSITLAGSDRSTH